MKLVILQIFFLSIFLLGNSEVLIGQNTKYQEAIQSADNYFNKGDYINAKASYQYALRFNKDDEYAKRKINECIDQMSSQSSERMQYSAHIRKADKHYKNNEYKSAIQSYKKALMLFSYEDYPRKQVEIIQKMIDDERELSSDYKTAITAGDRFFELKRFANARLEYQFALGLYPEQIHPKQRLEEIALALQDMSEKQKLFDETMQKAETFFNEAEWNKALDSYKQANKLFPNEEKPIRRINELKPLLAQIEQYNSIIESADELYMVKDWNSAKIKYEEAIALKPRESYPREMLDKVEVAIKNKATTELQDFNNAVKLGDQYIGQELWKEARSQFEFANRLKPEESYPKEKLIEIAEQIKIEEAAIALQAKFDELVQNGDLYFTAKEFEKAKEAFNEALLLKPDESYPPEQIVAIEQTQERIAEEKALLEKYQNKIKEADLLFNKEDYVNAKLAYEEARNFKAEEAYPQEKIAEVTVILDRIAAQQTAEENYRNAITLADSYFNNEDFENAKLEYNKARGFKNKEEYPQQQLLIIKDILEQRAIALQLAFDNLIAKADSLFVLKEYEVAKNVLKEAQLLKPEEKYPRQKTSEINAIIQENYRIAKIEYDKFITEADRFYKARVFEKALNSYQQAGNILPDELYAQTRIKEITDMFAAATIAVISESDLSLSSGEQKQIPFTPIPIKERKSNYFYLLIKSSVSEGNLRLIVNYGKDQTKNGGVIIRLNTSDNSIIHLVRVGTQYKWFSEDNNWISLQSEGGSVEIGLIKVSKETIL